MHIADFALERYFARYEFAVRHVLGASDVEGMRLDELLALADADARRRWESLTLGYTESLGLPALREEIAALYDGLSASDVLVFAGAEEGIFLSMHAILDAGDHAVVVTPAYQSLHEVARSIGAAVTEVPLDAANWELDPDAVERALRPNTRVVVLNFPHSPTGALIGRDRFARIVSVCEGRGVHLFSDEVYRFLELDDATRLAPAATLGAKTISLGVMSKAFALAGLRIGWIATRDAALRGRLASLKDYTTICSSAPSEVLALIALRARDRVLARSRAIVATNLPVLRDFMSRHADQLEWIPPRGGSVCFPRLREESADVLAERLIASSGVLILPGSRFGFDARHFRIGFGRRDMPAALDHLAAELGRR